MKSIMNFSKAQFNLDVKLNQIKESANEIYSKELTSVNNSLSYIVSQYILRETSSLIRDFAALIGRRGFLVITKFLNDFRPDPFLIGLSDGHFDEQEYCHNMENVKNQIEGIYRIQRKKIWSERISLCMSILATIIALAALFKS